MELELCAVPMCSHATQTHVSLKGHVLAALSAVVNRTQQLAIRLRGSHKHLVSQTRQTQAWCDGLAMEWVRPYVVGLGVDHWTF